MPRIGFSICGLSLSRHFRCGSDRLTLVVNVVTKKMLYWSYQQMQADEQGVGFLSELDESELKDLEKMIEKHD